MTYQIVIPMTGVGQRFVDAGYKELKPLIKVAGKPIVEHVLEMFPTARKVICIVSSEHLQRDTLISEILRIRPDALIKEISAHKLGPGHAISEAADVIDPVLPTLVSYCDWAGFWNVEEMLDQLTSHSGSILTYTGFHPHMLRSTKFAYVLKKNDFVVDIQEKAPYTNNPMEEEASAGCYGFATGETLLTAIKEQIKQNESLNGEFYISLTYKNLLGKGLKVGTVLMNKFYQWGTPEDLQDWIYWQNTVGKLPGKVISKIDSHNLVLAAGRGSRLASVSEVSKPNLRIAGQHLWEYSAPESIEFVTSTIVSRPEVEITSRGDVDSLIIRDVTEGQAITAKIGLEVIATEQDRPVNVLSSDNAFTPDIFQKAEEDIKEYDLIVWTSKKYPIAQLNPMHYAWINMIEKNVLKKVTPPNFADWEMIVGNFTFKTVPLALSLIQELVEKNIKVNGEFYLDSLVELAFETKLKVKTLEIPNFFAVGTPEEYFTYQYFRRGQ